MRIRDPGWKKFGSGILDGKNSDPGWKIFGSRILDGKNSDPGWKNSDPGSGMEKIRIRIRYTAANYSGAVDV